MRTRPRLEQRGEAGLAVAGVVVDDRQVLRALLDQRVDELVGHAGGAEAADHHGRAVGDVGDGVGERRDLLLDHRFASARDFAVRARPSIASA